MMSVVYFLQRANGDIKIGTTTDFRNRLTALRHVYGELRLLGLMEGDESQERQLHEGFSRYRVDGEFFEPHGDIIEFIHKRTSLQLPLALKDASKPKFRTRLKALMERDGLSRMDIVRRVRFSYLTVVRWETVPLNSLEAPKVKALMELFDCSYEDLVYVVEDDEK